MHTYIMIFKICPHIPIFFYNIYIYTANAKAISDAALAVVMLVAWDQDVDFDDLLGRWDGTIG